MREAEEIKDKLSVEKLRDLLDEALKDFVDYSGAVKHGVNSGRIFILLKKIEKQKTLLGISVVKRVQGMPSGKTGFAAWFESSPDSYVAEEKIFAPGYEAEEQFYYDYIKVRCRKDRKKRGGIECLQLKNCRTSRLLNV